MWISGSAVMTIDASRTIISWQVRMIARTNVALLGRRRSGGGHAQAGPFRLVRNAVDWRHPPVDMEAASASCRNYTEAPSVLSRAMSTTAQHPATPQPSRSLPRPMRADAARNHDKLLAAAREAFTEDGADASLEDIARRAGVGIGTLYRNFPTRQALLEAVYVDEVEAICRAADDLGGPRAVGRARRLAAQLRRLRDDEEGAGRRADGLPRRRGAGVPAAAASRSSRPARRCSSAPSAPARCAPTPS